MHRQIQKQTAELQLLARDLERRVAKRTASLEAANAALRKSEERHRTIIQTAMDGFWLTDMQERLLEVNEAYCRMSGYSAQELLAMYIPDLEAAETTGRTAAHLQLVMVRGEHRFETRHHREDGSIFDVEVSVQYQPVEGGRFVAFLRDITECKRAEELQHARTRLLLFANSHSLGELLDETLNEVEKLTGSLIGFYHFVEPDQISLSLQEWSTRTKNEYCKAEGKGMHYEIAKAGVWVDCVRQRKPVIHNDYASLPHKKGLPPGHATVVRELAVPVIRDNKIMAILGVGNKPTSYDEQDIKIVSLFADLVWDITERRRAEESLRQSQAELCDL